MKKINKKIITSIFVFFIILLLSISIIMANNAVNETNIEIDEEKIYYEIKYFDSKIIYMANLLNNIEKETNFYIDWEKLEKEIYSLYDYWNSVILDLNYLNIDKTDLTDFGRRLDELTISIKYQDKNKTSCNLVELYSKLIIYIDAINYNNYKNILLTKYNLLIAYSIAETGNWTLVHEYISNSSEYIYEVVKYSENNEYTQYNINQAYVAVKETENLINIKDKEVFYIKYKIAIQKLENI